MDASHPMSPFVPMLKELAEGRVERDRWLAWWAEHAAAIERAAKPGWFSGLKPRALNELPSAVMVQSQSGAGAILKQLGIPYEPSMRYADAWEAEFEAYQKEERRREQERAKRLAPGIAAVTGEFPKFGAFLKRRAKDLVEQIDPPASDEQVATLRAARCRRRTSGCCGAVRACGAGRSTCRRTTCWWSMPSPASFPLPRVLRGEERVGERGERRHT